MAVNFKINGKPYKVLLQNHPPDITLNTFIRQHANLPATKFMCLEGGCGVCICAVKGRHPDTNEHKVWATNSMGTLAGNLSIKHQHKEFPSDIFILLETLNAKFTIMGLDGKTTTSSVLNYLQMDMSKKILTKIIIEAKPVDQYLFNSYKIMPRAQNAHAFVNAGFLLEMANDTVKSARICFGGINPDFIHAYQTEKFLVGKNLFSNETIQGVMTELEAEINPDWVLPDASPEYRRKLACGLFYKFILGVAPQDIVKEQNRSGGDILRRSLSSGTQIYDTRKDMYPVTKPIRKIEAIAQCSGEAFYMNDLPPLPGEVWAAFVHATQANSRIAKIDASPALNIPGVVAFYSAKDIPGTNSFIEKGMFGFDEEEYIFCDDLVQFHSQPLGVIVAETADIAKAASEKVKVLYEKLSGSVMPTMQDVFENKAFHRISGVTESENYKESTSPLEGTKHIQSNFDIGSQYHYTMEPQTCVCIPTEDGLDVYSATQHMDLTQSAIAKCLDTTKSKVFLQVRRLGGGYGCKISRASQIACACAVASTLLNRPVRFVQSLESMMNAVGKRFACHCDYTVDVDDKGKIVKLTNSFYEDCGCTVNESPVNYLSTWTVSNCYDADGNWKISGKTVKTDAPSHTWCRAPGALEGIAMIENIMEHIACETQQDSADVRLRNLKPGTKMETLLPEFLTSTEYKARKEEIIKFNEQNRWRKRGLGLALMKYPTHYFGTQPATVSIYQGDGSVSISHGGIEMGQGLNTKVAQVAAYVLGVPLETIRIHPSDSFNGANATVTGGGVGSETACYAAKKACEELLLRMQPVRDTMENPTWLTLVQKCWSSNISLTASRSHKAGDLQVYDVWGLCLSEIEVDILTGNLVIKRVDILEDTGESLSPIIDVGQIEGAFIMGVGYWLTEKLVFNRQSGELLTNRTWTYKPPGAKDIPIDFRITLLQNSPNPAGFLRSKATGEPASCLAISVLFALRHALDSSRADAGITEKWFHLGAPSTPEDTVLNSGTSVEMFTLN
ncbi:xanthine dehydrogenase-like isoform X2 [Hermetia illucens]|uniref:xanthine dehydrogenase-like isoform X2 n=1 Tax=Hermetia illucens TaxID=343691 RepID=UPI0018CC3DA2|nr:xanthine dehydrogenase-like isoform X2 [Hermetia illucens]